MRFVLISLFIYLLIIGIHLLFCRLRISRRQQVNVLWGLGALGGIVYWSITGGAGTHQTDLWALPVRGAAFWLGILLLFPYYIFFTNADYDSPSQRIMNLLNKYKQRSYNELLEEMTTQDLIISRLDDLRDEGFIDDSQSRYQLLCKGIWLTRCMDIYKKIIGREIHG